MSLWAVKLRKPASWTWAIAMVAAAMLLPTSNVAAQESEDKEDNRGILEQVGDVLDGKIRLELSGDKLVCKFPSREDAQAIVGPIRTKFQSHGGSSYGGDRWNHRFDGNQLRGIIGRGTQNYAVRAEASAFYFHLFESERSDRLLMFEGANEESFSLIVLAGAKDVLRVRQDANGTILAQRIAEGESTAATANSYADLIRQHPEFVDSHVVGSIDRFGLGMPPSIYGDAFEKHVMAQIGFSDKRWQKFQPLLQGLDSDNFQTREETAKELTDSFDQWREAIRVGISRNDLSIETRSQLRKIYNKKADERAIETQALIDSIDLLNRVDYLVHLFDQTEDQRIESAILSRLKSITGKEFETPDDWIQFVSIESGNPEADDEPTEIAGDSANAGAISSSTEELSRLIDLTIEENQIRFNRSAWKEMFQNKSVETLLNEAKAEFDKRYLPETWLNMGDNFKLDRIEYPHVLFERVKGRMQGLSTRAYYSSASRPYYGQHKNVSLNRSFDIATAYGTLDMHQFERSNKEHPAEFLKLHIREKDNTGYYIWVNELKDSFQLLVVAKESDRMLQLQQDKNGCVVDDIRGKQITSLRSDDVTQFVAEHQSYLKESLLPLFSRIGINVDETMGGPLSFKNAEYNDPSQKK